MEMTFIEQRHSINNHQSSGIGETCANLLKIHEYLMRENQSEF